MSTFPPAPQIHLVNPRRFNTGNLEMMRSNFSYTELNPKIKTRTVDFSEAEKTAVNSYPPMTGTQELKNNGRNDIFYQDNYQKTLDMFNFTSSERKNPNRNNDYLANYLTLDPNPPSNLLFNSPSDQKLEPYLGSWKNNQEVFN